MFKPKAIYFEKEIINYPLGQHLMKQYKETPKIEIENHNNIEEMRKKQNSEFANTENGFLTLPTKFDMVDDILPLKHNGRIVIRMSVNPAEIINKVEFGTSRLKGRIEAINKLAEAGYKIGILIAPVILVENWQQLYSELIQTLSIELSEKARRTAFFEIIFMTYSYVHTKINEEAFPNAINLYDKEIMTGRGNGKYGYKEKNRREAEIFLREQMHKYFPNNKIEYVV